MHKFKSLTLLLTSLIILTSCNDSSISDSSSIDSSSSTSTSETVDSGWSKEQEALLETYCGEVIPYPHLMFNGKVEAYTAQYSSDTTILEISDESDSFTLQNYYFDLQIDGWTLTKNYNNNAISTDSNGSSYVELTRYSKEKDTAYMIWYFFDPGRKADESTGDPGYHSCNIIWCFNTLVKKENSNTDWTESDKATMQEALSSSMPFLHIGENYKMVQSNTNSLTIRDQYYKNNVKTNVSILEDNGYVLDKSLSKDSDKYTLRKTNEDGSSYIAQLHFEYGNYIEFHFLPKTNIASSWPEEAVNIIEKQISSSIPSFFADSYSYWIKNNNMMYIYAYGSDLEDDVYSSYSKALSNADYIYTDGYYINWEEDAIILFDISYNDDGSIDTFGILIGVYEPTSKFSDGWPTEQLSSFYKTQNIDVTVPSASLKEDTKPIKYETSLDYESNYKYYYDYIMENGSWMHIDTSDEETVKALATKYAKEATGVFLTIYDKDESICNSYINVLYELKWHRTSNNYRGYTYEDPDGKVTVFVGTYKYQTIIKIYLGSGEKHSPIFKFKDAELVLGLGDKVNSNLMVDMYPYEVSFTSSNSDYVSVDSKGNLTVSETAKVGSSVTITASMNVEGNELTTSMIVYVESRMPYTPINVIDKIANLYNSYYSYTTEDSSYVEPGHDDVLGNYFTTVSKTSDLTATKEFMLTVLLPNGFTTEMTEWKYEKYEGGPSYYIDYTCDGVKLNYRILIISEDMLLMDISAYSIEE